jgi:hypothetical protein
MSPGFEGAQQEFLVAHQHFREGRTKESVAAATKAFESTLKAICEQREWAYDVKVDTSKKLIDIVVANGLVPSSLLSYFSGLRTALESGLPTIGNKTSRHGQGPTISEVPEPLAAFALHLCAASIVFLVGMHQR